METSTDQHQAATRTWTRVQLSTRWSNQKWPATWNRLRRVKRGQNYNSMITWHYSRISILQHVSQSTPRPKSLKSQQPKIKHRPPTRTRSSMRSKVSIPRMQSTKCHMSNWRKKFYRCKIRTNKEMVLLSRQVSLVKRDLLVVAINSMTRRMMFHRDLETIVLSRCSLPAM